MAIALHTVSGGTVSAEDDARLYEKLTGGLGGIVDGGVCTSSGGLVVHVTAGWGIACGRIFSWDADNITVTGAGSGTVNGRLKIVIDLTDPSDPISIVSEASSSLSPLVTGDLNGADLVYEIALCTYQVSTTAVSSLVSNTLVSIVPRAASRLSDYVPIADLDNLYFRGNNPITTTANDIPTKWAALGTGIWTNVGSGHLNNQPAANGYIISIKRQSANSIVQLWYMDTNFYVRTGSVSTDTWTTAWTQVFVGSVDRSALTGGIVKSDNTTNKTLTMSLSGTTLTITYN